MTDTQNTTESDVSRRQFLQRTVGIFAGIVGAVGLRSLPSEVPQVQASGYGRGGYSPKADA